nr:hypothetical protein [Qaidamihabitans albus]
MGTRTDDDTVTVTMPVRWLWLLRIGGAALGFGAGFGVAPLANWLVDLTGSAPVRSGSPRSCRRCGRCPC